MEHKTIWLILVAIICLLLISTILFFVVKNHINGLQSEMSNLKSDLTSTNVSNQQLQAIIDSFPTQLKTNEDFNKLNIALVSLQKQLNNTNTENQELKDKVDELQKKLDKLSGHHGSSGGIVTGVY